MAFAVAQTAEAGCPVGWNSFLYPVVIDNGGSPACTTTVMVKYCAPGPGFFPTEQIIIDSVAFVDTCGFGITPGTMEKIGAALMAANPQNWSCTPCPQLTPQWEISWGGCMVEVIYNNGPDVVRTAYWCGEEGRCIDKYEVCCDAMGNIVATRVGRQSSPGCNPNTCPGGKSVCP